MNPADLSQLHQKVVLVTSAVDTHNPPTGRRGTLVVERNGGDAALVSVEIDFPEMFTSRAHRRRIVLSREQTEQLMQTGHYGAYSLRIAERLDPELVPGND